MVYPSECYSEVSRFHSLFFTGRWFGEGDVCLCSRSSSSWLMFDVLLLAACREIELWALGTRHCFRQEMRLHSFEYPEKCL
jgi:hypothetical protein